MTAETYLDLKEVPIRNSYEKEITLAETVRPALPLGFLFPVTLNVK